MQISITKKYAVCMLLSPKQINNERFFNSYMKKTSDREVLKHTPTICDYLNKSGLYIKPITSIVFHDEIC